ncbi:MAG: dihydrolipoyllysine-residue acetyltransferase [Thermoleophilia bacterium]
MAEVTEVRVPDIGDYSDVPVIEVLVAPGDDISSEDPLIVLESDKATMEVPSPASGHVEHVAVAPGETVSQGDLILTLSGADGGESTGEGDTSAGEVDEESTDEGSEPHADAGPEEPEPEASSSEAADAESGAPPVADAPEPAASAPRGDSEVYAGPGARKLAREKGIELSTVSGSGHKGRILREDIEAAVKAAGAAPAPAEAPSVAGLPAWPSVDFSSFGEVEATPLSRIKRISGPVLARNWVAIPHVTQFDEADITDLEAFRKAVNAEHADSGVKVTMVSLLIKACANALRQFPEFNSSLDGDQLILKRYVNVGFAADTDAGLMVPVVRDADRKGLLEISRDLAELSGAARDGTIKREQMQGGTFTISSLGGIGGTAFTPIVNAPEVAILGVSRSSMAPVWNGETFHPRLMLPLSLSYDHRVIDGADAARFTTYLSWVLADAGRMVL